MCEICQASTKEEKNSVHNDLNFRAQQLTEFAKHLHDLSNGKVNPHSSDITTVQLQYRARSIVKYLVEQWI